MPNSYSNLRKRSNYLFKEYDGNDIVIYEDHRCILNVIKYGLENNLINKKPNVIYFDYHDDFLYPRCGETAIKKFLAQSRSFRELFDFVEFELSTSDDDWVIAGMELQLINDVVLIGAEETQNLPDNNQYVDHLGNNHQVHSIRHLWDSLDNSGELVDSFKSTQYADLRKSIGYNENDDLQFSSDIHPFILDIDLDCFSTYIWQIRKAVPNAILYDYFRNTVNNHSISPNDFFMSLLDRSEVLTMCLESGSCGGINQSNEILNNLNNILFYDQIDL